MHQDGTVKVWDARKALVRDLQLAGPVITAAYISKQGDIVIGYGSQIHVVRAKVGGGLRLGLHFGSKKDWISR